MSDQPYRRKTILLYALIILAAAYCLWFQQRQMLIGYRTVDGSISVLLGLYICSRPAGNAIDLFFFERSPFHRVIGEWSSIRWLALNILTLFMGWILIYLGTAHLTAQTN